MVARGPFTFQGFRAGKLTVQNPIVTSTAYQIASVYEDGYATDDKPSTVSSTATGAGSLLQQKRAAKADPTIMPT